MKDAMFKHHKTDGLYTVVAKVTASLGAPLWDMAPVGIRKTDHGYIAVCSPNLGLEHEATVQGAIENGADCVLYRGTDGRLWLRQTGEFIDGRFIPLNNKAACMMPPQWHFGAMGAA